DVHSDSPGRAPTAGRRAAERTRARGRRTPWTYGAVPRRNSEALRGVPPRAAAKIIGEPARFGPSAESNRPGDCYQRLKGVCYAESVWNVEAPRGPGSPGAADGGGNVRRYARALDLGVVLLVAGCTAHPDGPVGPRPVAVAGIEIVTNPSAHPRDGYTATC